MSISTMIILTLTLLSVEIQGLGQYLFRFDYKKYEPDYPLGFLPANYTLRINLTTTKRDGLTFGLSDTDIGVYFASDLTYTGIPCVSDCSTSPYNCALICDILISDYYRIYVLPDNQVLIAEIQTFQIEAGFYPTISGGPSNLSAVVTPIFKATEVFRYTTQKLIYIDGTKNASFSLNPAQDDGFGALDQYDTSLQLYKVTSVSDGQTFYDYSSSPNLLLDATLTYSPASQNATYTTTTPLIQGYYVLNVIYYPDNQRFNIFPNWAQITFQSAPYPCPFPFEYPDTYQNFQPCLGESGRPSEPGFPCLAFDQLTRQCKSCIFGYKLDNGICMIDTSCPERQYFHFGRCFAVSPDCFTFDPFTGYCLTCVNNASQIINGMCVAELVQCGNRQFVCNNTCVNVSDLCLSFSNETGQCLSCLNNFDLVNGTCVRQPIVCPQNQYLAPDNFTCKNYPANCPSFDTFNEVCRTCARGFYLSEGICQQILCPPRQVPSVYGLFCVKVSELCKDYDTLTGDCLTCTISNYFVSNGRCVEAISPLAGCQERESLGFGECLNAEVNCLSYNLQTQNCDQCVNGFFKDFTGRCTLQNRVCQSDEVSIQGICIQMPRDCAQVDGLGLCVRCIDPVQYRIINRQCIFTPVCTSRQYKNENDVCIDVSNDCLSFNPSTGLCYTCVNNIPAQQGICCPIGQSVLNGQCVDVNTYTNTLKSGQGSTLPTCIAFHPSLGICLACNGNFQVNPIFPTTCI